MEKMSIDMGYETDVRILAGCSTVQYCSTVQSRTVVPFYRALERSLHTETAYRVQVNCVILSQFRRALSPAHFRAPTFLVRVLYSAGTAMYQVRVRDLRGRTTSFQLRTQGP